MKIFPFLLAFLICGNAAIGSGPALPLRFHHMPLGNVVRVLSARFHAQVTITAGATAPVTGDFTGMDLPHALAEAARQAGLVVVALGADPKAGFELEPPPPTPPAPPPNVATEAAAAARRRAELLRRQAELIQEADRLNGGTPAP